MELKIIFLVVVLIGLGIGVYKIRKPKIVVNLLLCFFSILFMLLLIEFIYRNFWKKRQVISTVNNYYKADSLMGYRFDPGQMKAVEYFENGDTIYNTYYTILADTNANGISYPMRKGYRSDTSGQEAVFLGCSFTLGEGLADEETLPYQYGQLTGVSAVNRGCNGLGIHQVYELFKLKYANQDNHNRVFVYSFFSEHFFRAYGMYGWNNAGPYFIISGDTLQNKGPFYKIKAVKGHRLAQYASFLGAFSFIKDNIERITVRNSKKNITEADLAPYYLMFRQMAEMIKRSGGRFIVLNWDDSSTRTGSKILDRDIANNKINKIISPYGAIVLPVSLAIDRSRADYFIPHDGHPSVLANKALAEYLKKNTKP
jgi:hypothetical protein